MSERKQTNRDQLIIRTSILGIAANVLLATFKAIVGLLANSIAVTLDAVNNLSDALSSVITIVGTKLASKKPDKKHPLGYGRIEYLSAMIVSAIVLYAGITSGIESIKKIIHPEEADYSTVTLIVIATAIVVKLLLGRYVKGVGEKVHSGALTASGSDASFDAILSLSVLISAIIFMTTGISLEAIVGLVIAFFIIKSGLEMLSDTLDDILGKRIEGDYLSEIRTTICSAPEVHGAYDLILHSYGPEKYIGSVHIEVDDTLGAEEIDLLERRIGDLVYEKHGVILTGIGIYSRNTRSEEVKRLRADITRIVMEHEGVLQMHGFYADEVKKVCQFDMILDFSIADRQAIYDHIFNEISELYPDYKVHIAMDIDVL